MRLELIIHEFILTHKLTSVFYINCVSYLISYNNNRSINRMVVNILLRQLDYRCSEWLLINLYRHLITRLINGNNPYIVKCDA